MTDDNWSANGLDYAKLSDDVLEELSKMPERRAPGNIVGKMLIGIGGVIVAALIAVGFEYWVIG
jgi:hypothetical protein